MAVVSAAFESGFALSAYVQFSCFLEMQDAELRKIMNIEPASPVAHGFGTYKWLKEDVTMDRFCIRRDAVNGFMEASVYDAGQTLVNFNINQNSLTQSLKAEEVLNYQLKVDVEGVTFSINVKELGDKRNVKQTFHLFTSQLLILLVFDHLDIGAG